MHYNAWTYNGTVPELVRVFFVNAGPNLTSVFQVAGVLFGTAYRSGNPADALRGVNTLEAIKDGGAAVNLPNDMPAWAAGLSDDQINTLTKYIRGFCRK
jgi:nitrite reductase (NO-forming)